MCVVSMVIDAGRTIDPYQWTKPAIDSFKIILDEAAVIDDETGQPDCVDPEKATFLETLEEILERLEAIEDRLDESPDSAYQRGRTDRNSELVELLSPPDVR